GLASTTGTSRAFSPGRCSIPAGGQPEPQALEDSMDGHSTGRRDFLKQITALSAAPIVAGLQPKSADDPSARLQPKVTEVEFLRTPRGRQLMARVYQPQGAGPFPTVLDLHGGAWRRKDRFAEGPQDRGVAPSGVDLRRSDLRP